MNLPCFPDNVVNANMNLRSGDDLYHPFMILSKSVKILDNIGDCHIIQTVFHYCWILVRNVKLFSTGYYREPPKKNYNLWILYRWICHIMPVGNVHLRTHACFAPLSLPLRGKGETQLQMDRRQFGVNELAEIGFNPRGLMPVSEDGENDDRPSNFGYSQLFEENPIFCP